MQVRMNYGRTGWPVELGPEWQVTVVERPPMPFLDDPAGATRAALEQPVGCEPLRQLARGRRSACILICDITRPAPNGLVLPILLRELQAAGMSPAAIQVLVATGLHRPNFGAELEEVVGDADVMRTVRVCNHDARCHADHADLGSTARGTPIRIDRRFVEADLRLIVGLVEPHFMAGYSGGRKLVAPGIAHHDAIAVLHSARYLEAPGVQTMNLRGNPLHEEQMEIARRVGEMYAVNTTLDERRRLAFVNFGDLAASHEAACAFVKARAAVRLLHRFPVVLTSSAGYPLDATFYQTVKAMVSAREILAPGGDLIVLSACNEGLGSAEYEEAQRRLVQVGPERFLENLRVKSRADIDEWQTEMQLKAMREARVHLVSRDLPQEAARWTAVNVTSDLDGLLRDCRRRAADGAIAVIPEGPYITPYVAG